MDTQKILLFTLALFCFDLSDGAPVFNGLLKNTNASEKHEEGFRSEVSAISDNVTTYNVSKDDLMNNLTNGDLLLVLHGKSTFKKIVGKVKSWKNKITGGGGSNKVKNNKDGSKGGGGISIHRPIRPIRSSDDSTITYIMLGVYGVAFVIGTILGCLKIKDEKDKDENTEKEMEDKNKDGKESEEDVNNNENSEKDKKEEIEILKKKDSKEDTYIVQNTAL